jgi:nitrite reductase/ring-hydroxylating ferredoxin subunit
MGKLIKVCNTRELQENKAAKFLIEDDFEVVAYKIDGKYYAVANTCPHNHSHVMHEGVVDKELYLTCPVHGYRFHLETGEVPPNSAEMSGKLEIYKTKIENEVLYVEKKDKSFKFWNW